MLLLFIFGVQFMATEKIVWNTTFYNLDVYNIHQNLAKQYNDRTDLIVDKPTASAHHAVLPSVYD